MEPTIGLSKGVPDGGVVQGTEGAEGGCSPHRGSNSVNRPDPPELLRTVSPTKEYKWRDPGCRPHMWQRLALLDIRYEERPLGLSVFETPLLGNARVAR